MRKINTAAIALALFLSTLLGIQAEHVKKDKTYKYYSIKEDSIDRSDKHTNGYIPKSVEQNSQITVIEKLSTNTTKEEIGAAVFIEPESESEAKEYANVPVDIGAFPPTGVSSTLGKIGILLIAAGAIVEAMRHSIKED